MTSYEYQTIGRRSTVFSTKGLVASSQPLASEAGISILRRGGNAADAAIAIAAALNVTEPCNCGIGGDVFALYWDAEEKKVKAINGSGRSPKALSLERVREDGLKGERIPNDHIHGVTVPGAAAAWVDIHEKWGSGKLTLEEVLAPACSLGEEGFAVHQQAAFEWSEHKATLLKASKGESTYPFLLDGEIPKPEEIFSNPALAETFRTLAKDGKDGFYKGRIAEALVAACAKRGGLMTLSDLAGHSSEFVEPISYTYRGAGGHTVWECPPNGQGLAALIAMGIIDALREEGVVDLGEYKEGSVEWLHVMIEAMRLAFADAHAYIADPSTFKIPVEQLLSKEYLRERAKLFNSQKATAQYAQGRPMSTSDTVYFTAADKDGNAISMIMSNYLGFGTGVVPENCGFSLQSRGGGFVLEEGHPNCLEGGKRPYHTIIPAMVTKDDELFMSYGVMGGAMQPQGHLQVLMNILHHKHHPQKSLDSKRFCIGSTAWAAPGPEKFYNRIIAIEDGIPPEIVQKLVDMGHKMEVIKGNDQVVFGKGQVILRMTDGRTGKRVWSGGSDPRGDGCALAQI